MLWPYIEQGQLYQTLQISGDPTDPEGSKNQGEFNYRTNIQVATATSIPTYVCPSNPNSKYQDPGDSPPQFALANYKGMGATCMASLNMMTQPNGTPPYGTSDMHPDGAMYPGNGVRIGDITDGTAHTIMCVETIDDTQSVWTLGTDVTLVGLPYRGDVSSTKPTGAIQSFTNQTAQGITVAFYMPAGFTGTFDKEGNAGGTPGPGYSAYRTYLSFDFGPNGADKDTYPLFQTNNRTVSGLPGGNGVKYTMGANGDGPQSNQPAYGPSSGHSAIVNHLFADGSVHSLSRQIDVSAYMFLDNQERRRPESADPLMANLVGRAEGHHAQHGREPHRKLLRGCRWHCEAMHLIEELGVARRTAALLLRAAVRHLADDASDFLLVRPGQHSFGVPRKPGLRILLTLGARPNRERRFFTDASPPAIDTG